MTAEMIQALVRHAGPAIPTALLMLLSTSAPVWGHGDPPDIAFYGHYSRGTARCQRAVGVAARTCFDTALAEHITCMNTLMAGGECDTTARDTAIEAAKERARLLVADSCTDIQLNILQFLGLDDAQDDVAEICGDQADTAISLFYRPVTYGSAGDAVAGDDETCVRLTAYYATKVVKRALRTQEHALDRMAATNLGVAAKRTAIDRVNQRIARARQLAQQRIETACGPTFAALYATDVDAFLKVAEARANCMVGAAYVQNAVTCPPAVCGNGAREGDEECDDGNDIDDDACRNNCTRP